MKKNFYNYISSICIIFTLSFLFTTLINRIQNYIGVSNDFILLYFFCIVLAKSLYTLINHINFKSCVLYHIIAFFSLYIICYLFLLLFQFIMFSFYYLFIYTFIFCVTYICVNLFMKKKNQREANDINNLIQKYNDTLL